MKESKVTSQQSRSLSMFRPRIGTRIKKGVSRPRWRVKSSAVYAASNVYTAVTWLEYCRYDVKHKTIN